MDAHFDGRMLGSKTYDMNLFFIYRYLEMKAQVV